ncbi:MAG TPA: Na+/H+ antiporter subunit E [Candidatus Krumholzibacterium sp.]|nr:Na+/H+ antiporter subunit E [Candidatus Krumholzibacterium sp.]
MTADARKYLGKGAAAALTAVIFTAVYVLWSGTFVWRDAAVFLLFAIPVSFIFVRGGIFPRPGLKSMLYGIFYVPYLVVEIVKANFDVASRIVRPKIPLNPGIVSAKTRLKSRIGRAVLANSITLTPGTLSVEITGDTLYIHWIDVKGRGGDEEAAEIVEGFEKYLEVIFG